MASNKAKIGVALFILLALIPLYLFFHQSGAKKSVVGEHAEQPKESEASVEKSAESGVPAKISVTTGKEVEQVEAKEMPDTTGTPGLEPKKVVPNSFLVVIDPGHQEQANLGKEPVGPGGSETKIKVTGGTSGVATGKPEYKLTLEASLILGELLESKGIKVIYTRTTHTVNLSNRERAEIANQNHADLFIRIHADGSTDRNVRGLSVLTPAKNSPYTKTIFEDSLKASQLIIDETNKNPALKVNGISYRGDMTGFNWSKVPCTLVEMGFMTNPVEDKNLSDTVYLKKLLNNVADGILDYVSYKE
ncbi:N-acetylmuramoyl-L-alanine amidase [Neobacillus pocheonensis]|uniref:N-acetylmuramoyl-L-alanine amidase family protein n=1 Tax=Neobacillus pocheonensis TaxID=363869 RepID=UPI003D2DBC7F